MLCSCFSQIMLHSTWSYYIHSTYTNKYKKFKHKKYFGRTFAFLAFVIKYNFKRESDDNQLATLNGGLPGETTSDAI